MATYHTLRPTGINTRDTLYSGTPPNIADNCYQNVNEATKSETDYNYNLDTTGFEQTQSVLYTLETYSGGDAISRIILKGYYKVGNTGEVSGAQARFRIKTGGTIYEDSFFNPDTSAYTLYTKVYTTNPKTGNQWSAAEVNALAAGDSLQSIFPDAFNNSRSYCCQFWVTVVEAAVESGGNFFLVM
jgi:hypothetical protein